MSRIIKRASLPSLAALSLLATSVPASAQWVDFSRGGCTGAAYSFVAGFHDHQSQTTVQSGTTCTYRYLDCYWGLTSGGTFHGCPGWVTYTPSFHAINSLNVTSYHTLCEVGPPECSQSYPLIPTSAGTFNG